MTCKGYMKHVIRNSIDKPWGYTELEEKNARRITNMLESLMKTQGWFIRDPEYYGRFEPDEWDNFCIELIDHLNIMTIDEFVRQETKTELDELNYITDDLLNALVDRSNKLREFREESGTTFRFKYGEKWNCDEVIISAEYRDLDELVTDTTIHERYRDGLKVPGMYFGDEMIQINPQRNGVGGVPEWLKLYLYAGGNYSIDGVADEATIKPDLLKQIFRNEKDFSELSLANGFDLSRLLSVSTERLIVLADQQSQEIHR